MATSISSHSRFKRQGADENHQNNQQESLLPPRKCEGQVSYREDKFEYSSILELSDDEKRLLEDIMSLTDMQELRKSSDGFNQSAYHLQTQMTPSFQTGHPRYPTTCPSYSATPSVSDDLSKYALDAIFHNLIYPDVCQGQFFTLETLVQNTRDEQTRTGYVRNSYVFTKGGHNRINSGASEIEYVPSLHEPCHDHRYGKRKRSRDLSHDSDDRKRVKCVQSAHNSNSFHLERSPHSSDNGRVIAHKRVRELMCHI